MLDEGINTPRIRRLIHHIMIVISNDEHQESAQKNADDTADKHRLGKIIAPRHNESPQPMPVPTDKANAPSIPILFLLMSVPIRT